MKYIPPTWRIGRFPRILRRASSVLLIFIRRWAFDVGCWAFASRFRRPSFYGIPLLLASALVLFSATDSDRAAESGDSMTNAYAAYAQFFGLNPTNLAADAYMDFDDCANDQILAYGRG